MANLATKTYIHFFVLVYLLSIPFWILGALGPDTTKILPIKLPISALMTFCPLIAAVILVYKKQKMPGVKQLLKLAFDIKKIKDKKWYLPVVFLMPLIALISFWYEQIQEGNVPESQPSPLAVFIFFCVYFICAIGEEIGWSGYAIGPLQEKYGALKASMILGFVWALWHLIPYTQMGKSAVWIFWQCIGTVALRIIMVWLFNNTGKSIFAMVLFHTMINISPYLIPNYGPNYNPFIFDVLLLIVVAMIIFRWDSKTLAHYSK
jgi:uncharacterized protein